MAIALGFAAVIGGLVWLGFSLEEKYLAERAVHQEAPIERGPAVEESSPPREPIQWPSELPSLAFLGAALMLGGWLWTLIEALDEGAGWFFAVFLGNWLGAFIFFILHPGRALMPMILFTAGILLTFWPSLGWG